ncbi:MAG: DUF4249 domain-containing protein [Candidatus Marinimicrobia bacterium]|nr:DUF4249 domain-containing protein [Candidatus Neomarinimicrobiota bacterium]
MRKKQIIAFMILIFLLINCGNWGWEPLETNNQPQLNIIGVLSLNKDLPSFVYVSHTLNLQEKENLVDRQHTVIDTQYHREYYPEADTVITDSSNFTVDTHIVNIVYSNFLIPNAEVTISNGSQDFTLKPTVIKNQYYIWKHQVDTLFRENYELPGDEVIVFTDTTGKFQPKPQNRYYLNVKTEKFGKATGTVVTPPDIKITNRGTFEDTLTYFRTYTLKWHPLQNYKGDIFIDPGGFSNNIEDDIITGDSLYKFIPEIRSYYHQVWEDLSAIEKQEATQMKLIIRSMDENYYNYFCTDRIYDFVSFMLGETISASSYGIEGGYGVFGAVDFAKLQRHMKVEKD